MTDIRPNIAIADAFFGIFGMKREPNMIHQLKIWPEFFQAVIDGRKPFEIRKDDRNFMEGDTLELLEWNPNEKRFTGRAVSVLVTYLLNEEDFGLKTGYCVMGIKRVEAAAPAANHPPVPPNDERFVQKMHHGGEWYFRLPDGTLINLLDASPAWRRIIAAVAEVEWDKIMLIESEKVYDSNARSSPELNKSIESALAWREWGNK